MKVKMLRQTLLMFFSFSEMNLGAYYVIIFPP
jgi:hypothetical protein